MKLRFWVSAKGRVGDLWRTEKASHSGGLLCVMSAVPRGFALGSPIWLAALMPTHKLAATGQGSLWSIPWGAWRMKAKRQLSRLAMLGPGGRQATGQQAGPTSCSHSPCIQEQRAARATSGHGLEPPRGWVV